MATLVLDTYVEDQILEDRRRSGADRFDEVWDGVYIMSPLANNEHQQLATRLSTVIEIVLNFGEQGDVFAGVNVSDQADDWKRNFRCLDVAVFLRGTSAINRETHWLGGPDFAVEIVSKGDRAREKLDFYGKVSTRELLIVDRDPWALELYRLADGTLSMVGTCLPGQAETLRSEVLPLGFRLLASEPRPIIEMIRQGQEAGEPWRV